MTKCPPSVSADRRGKKHTHRHKGSKSMYWKGPHSLSLSLSLHHVHRNACTGGLSIAPVTQCVCVSHREGWRDGSRGPAIDDDGA